MTTATEPVAQQAQAPVTAEPAKRDVRNRLLMVLHRHWHLWVLLALTLVGGFIRFYWITRPVLWYDETMTYGRTCGTYQDMLDYLQFDGFPPLHYSLYWLLGQFFTMTPVVMRFVPALAGTLMIPAMYFLSRQFTTRRTSVVVAAFTAVSAYMLNYSHDAKMYMHFWLFLVLHIGCLLWWFTSGLRVAWLAWVAAGVAMVGLHFSAMTIVPLELLFLLTHRWLPWRTHWRSHWKKPLLLLIGLVIVGAGPLGYYLGYNRWVEKTGGFVPDGTEQPGEMNWGASGIIWVDWYHQGRTAPEIALHSLSSFLMSFEWPRPAEKLEKDLSGNPVIAPRIMAGAVIAMSLIIALAALGALPWPAAWRGERLDDPPAEPWWRNLLWLSAWIIIPTYAIFYLRSVDDFVSPVMWLGRAFDSLASLWPWANSDIAWPIPLTSWTFPQWAILTLAALLAVSAGLTLWRPPPSVLAIFAAIVGAALVGTIIWTDTSVRTGAGMSYDIAVRDQAIQWICGAALLLGAPLVWYFAAHSTPQRLARLSIFLLVVGGLFLICFAAYWYFDAVRDQFRDNYLAKNPGSGEGWKQQWRTKWQSIWMPRYVAVIFPALAIALCMLLMRLPTRALRIIAIAIVLGVNLLNGMARLFAGTEPPVDLIAADIVAAQNSNGAQRTYFNFTEGGAHPSHGSIMTIQGRYYLNILSNFQTRPLDFRRGTLPTNLRLDRFEKDKPLPVDRVRKDASANPALQRLIVWEYFKQGTKIPESRDVAWEQSLLTALGPGWSRPADSEIFPIRMYWSWRQLGWTQRRTFVRSSAPATQPAVP